MIAQNIFLVLLLATNTFAARLGNPGRGNGNGGGSLDEAPSASKPSIPSEPSFGSSISIPSLPSDASSPDDEDQDELGKAIGKLRKPDRGADGRPGNGNGNGIAKDKNRTSASIPSLPSNSSLPSKPSLPSEPSISSQSEDSIDSISDSSSDEGEELGQLQRSGFGNNGGIGKGNNNRFGKGFGKGNNATDFVTIACSGELDFSCNLPNKKRFDDADSKGVFVCRKKAHSAFDGTVLKEFPICIPTDRAVEDDECGCCGSECPKPCSACPCQLGKSNNTGVEVLITGMDEPLCVPSFASMMMVYHGNDRVTCNTECVNI